jgi:NAD(P)-dependent dehydrogenase (short-subunit alcohol dehydrogenase family)
MAQNAHAAAYCTMAAWPGMSRLTRGVIVNVASMAVYDPLVGFFAYAAAKGAVAAMTVSAAKEGASCGIEAYCVCPGAVETPLLRSIVDASALPAAETLRPEEVAEVVMACVTGDRRADNGKCIPVLPRTASVRNWWDDWSRKNPSGWLGMEAVWGSGQG